MIKNQREIEGKGKNKILLILIFQCQTEISVTIFPSRSFLLRSKKFLFCVVREVWLLGGTGKERGCVEVFLALEKQVFLRLSLSVSFISLSFHLFLTKKSFLLKKCLYWSILNMPLFNSLLRSISAFIWFCYSFLVVWLTESI